MHCTKVLFGRFDKSSRIILAVKSFSAYLSGRCKVKNFSVMPNTEDFDPPKALKGITVLDKNLFKKNINISSLVVDVKNFCQTVQIIKPFVLKVRNLKPVVDFNENMKKCMLDPNLVESWNSFNDDIKAKLQNLGIDEHSLTKETLELNYENYSAQSILKTILPGESVHSFSLIGHIIHLNLPESLNEYKKLIAQIFLDKTPYAKTVVCKKGVIENTFRFFDMEILCGDTDLVVTVKENGCTFKLDFSKVFWNPRLGVEHERVKKVINFGDVLFDVFAGIGPFAIQAAKKKCMVFANDLNPESVKWLNYNIKKNKIDTDYIKVFNKDGGDFILNEAKSNLIKTWENKYFNGKIYFVMNLPALALTFLKNFKGLITKNEISHLNLDTIKANLPIIYCYFFNHKEKDSLEVIENNSGIKFSDIEHSITLVRAVAPSKIMYRLTFEIPFNLLLKENTEESDEPLAKKSCMTK